MSTAVIGQPVGAEFRCAQSLESSGGCFWFLVAVIGQWMFVLDIVSFYGRAVATGDLASWNKLLSAGYVPGNRPYVRPVQIRHDDRTEAAKGVVALGSAPLRKVDVLIQHFRCRDVVDAGVPENIVGGFALRYILAIPADDNPQLALVGDLALVARGPLDGVAGPGH